MSEKAKLDICRGVHGHMAVYLGDLRIAGQKPWGGGTTIYEFEIVVDDDRIRDAFMALWPEVEEEHNRLHSTLLELREILAHFAAPDFMSMDIVKCLRKIDEALQPVDV